MISFSQGGFPSRRNHYLGTASGAANFRAVPDFGTHTPPAARPGIWGGVWGLGSGVWGLGCFGGKRFLHDWASERRSRRATTGKRLVRTSRIFFVFMGKVTNMRNPCSVRNSTDFLWVWSWPWPWPWLWLWPWQWPWPPLIYVPNVCSEQNCSEQCSIST